MCVELVKLMCCMVGWVIIVFIMVFVLVGVFVIKLMMLFGKFVFCKVLMMSLCVVGEIFELLSMMVLLYVSGNVIVCIVRMIGVFYGVMFSIMFVGWCMFMVRLFGILDGMILFVICVIMVVVFCKLFVVRCMLKLVYSVEVLVFVVIVVVKVLFLVLSVCVVCISNVWCFVGFMVV